MKEFPIISRRFLTNMVSRPALRNNHSYALREVRAIIMHWTANTDRGAHALANRNYFNLGSRSASAHFCVDDHSIIQCIPEDEVAFHVGAIRYKPIGRQIMAGSKLGPNYFTLAVEMCVNSDGDWAQTYAASGQFAAFLFLKHRLPAGSIHRHFDITGKDCPKMLLDEASWHAFLDQVQTNIRAFESQKFRRGISTTNNLNVRSGPGMEYKPIGTCQKDEPVMVFEQSGNWLRIEPHGWVYKNFVNYDT